MSYVPRRIRRRKLKIGRLLIVAVLTVALGVGSYFAIDHFFLREKPVVILDDVLEELQPQLTRKLIKIENPFDMIDQRADTIEINGEIIDLEILFADYQSLYYLVEPMPEGEVVNQFVEIYLWQKPIYQRMIDRDPSIQKRIDMFGHEYVNDELYFKIMDEFARQLLDLAEAVTTSSDPALSPYKSSFVYDTIRLYYMYLEPQAVYARMRDREATLSAYDQELYVRMFKTFALMYQQLYAKYGITYQCPLCNAESTK
jgi:hypothetical protein